MNLAPFAFEESLSQGRKFPEPEHPYRTIFQRDRDRIIHTKAFRRLERKTQVFTPDFSDHFRNRLTHTLEVSQIARTVAHALGLNGALCEVLALGHDIGHPPFGHEGERVLNKIMEAFGSGFDHNLQALRIVEGFEEKYIAFRGLNLSFEVREGIIKHSRDYPSTDRIYVELADYRLGEKPPLEAQLIDFADEIAYNTADLDDGFSSGFISLKQIRSGSQLFRSLHDEVLAGAPQSTAKLQVTEAIRRLIDRLVTSLILTTQNALEVNRIDSVAAVRQWPERIVAFDPETAACNAELKAFLHQNLYSIPQLRYARESAEGIIRALFHHYRRDPTQLPERHQGRIDSGQIRTERVVCDYIAGMTDFFAQGRYREIKEEA